jgi:hypothetical protein
MRDLYGNKELPVNKALLNIEQRTQLQIAFTQYLIAVGYYSL